MIESKISLPQVTEPLTDIATQVMTEPTNLPEHGLNIEEEFIANGCVMFKPYHLLKYISTRSPISVADIGRNWKPGRDVQNEFKDLYPKKGGKVSLIKILCNSLVKFDLLSEYESPKATAHTSRGRMSSCCYGITPQGRDYLARVFDDKKIERTENAIKTSGTDIIKPEKKKRKSTPRKKKISDDEQDYEFAEDTDDDESIVKEEEALRATVYFKEESSTTKKRRNSSADGNSILQQPFFQSVLPNTTFVHNQPPPLLPQTAATKTSRDDIKPNIPKKKLDQDRLTHDRYIATLEEFIEQQNKALMQKDHLINIKDQTIEQLQRHIESLSSRWVSREIKPYVQYSMTVNPPTESTPQLVQSQTSSSHQSQNIRYQGYLSEPVDPMQTISFSTKPDPSLVRENDNHQKANVVVDHHHPTCSIIIKNDPLQHQQQHPQHQQQQPQPQQPPEPLNQTVNELMSE